MIDDRPYRFVRLQMDKNILRDLKKAAAQNNTSVSELLNEIADKWLKSDENNTYTNTYLPEIKDNTKST